ncbi:hypothetical protein MKEN_00445000 [Mycena kentingensis (nom. inval.)]|nr:hypothetical protein MKEN_00445000 [Mycena kentingensis (nom. inval.)]
MSTPTAISALAGTSSYSLFPNVPTQVLCSLVHFFGLTILTFFLTRRILTPEFGWRGLGFSGGSSQFSWARLCVLLIFVDSYLFLLASGVLVFGVGLQTNAMACAAGIFLCVLCYATSKVLIYLFLAEKIYIVWGAGRPRKRCVVYLLCQGSVTLYAVVVVMMFVYRVHHFRGGDGACVLGLRPAASIPLLCYDLYINILLTVLFLWPIFRSQYSNVQLRRVATRTLIASAIALTTSTINMAVLTLLHGRELGWVCLSSCGADVVCNAAAIFLATRGARTGTSALSGTSGNRSRAVQPPAATGADLVFATLSGSRESGSLGLPAGHHQDESGGIKSVGAFFPMRELSGREKEFKIHVTKTSFVSTSPTPGELTISEGRSRHGSIVTTGEYYDVHRNCVWHL